MRSCLRGGVENGGASSRMGHLWGGCLQVAWKPWSWRGGRADCKSAGFAFPGSNPGAATLGKTPSDQETFLVRGGFSLAPPVRFGVDGTWTCLTSYRPYPSVDQCVSPRRPPG